MQVGEGGQVELVEADFHGEGPEWSVHADTALKGNFDLLGLTRPDVVAEVHRAYLRAGADILTTNTFSATSIAQTDYGTQELVRDINVAAARVARLPERDKTLLQTASVIGRQFSG